MARIGRDSVIFLTYDEHGGYYDHVAPPQLVKVFLALQTAYRLGQCADLSNPPSSQQPGGGAECSANPFSATDTSVIDAGLLCPDSQPTLPLPIPRTAPASTSTVSASRS